MKSRITKPKTSAKTNKPNTSKKLEEMLQDQLSQTEPGPVYFWHAEGDDGYLGQWYQASFTWRKPVDDGKDGEVEELVYQNAEQYVASSDSTFKCLLFLGI